MSGGVVFCVSCFYEWVKSGCWFCSCFLLLFSLHFGSLVLFGSLALFGSVWFCLVLRRVSSLPLWALWSGAVCFLQLGFSPAGAAEAEQTDILCAELLVKRPPAAAARTIKNLHITPRPLFYSAHKERTAGNWSCEHEKPPQIINQTQLLSLKQKRETKRFRDNSHVHYYYYYFAFEY